MRNWILCTAEIVDVPHMVSPLPYINFLRYFKRKSPGLGLCRLLQEASVHWAALTIYQKTLFSRKSIFARIKRISRTARRKALLRRNKTGPNQAHPVRRPIYDSRPSSRQLRKRVRKRKLSAAVSSSSVESLT